MGLAVGAVAIFPCAAGLCSLLFVYTYIHTGWQWRGGERERDALVESVPTASLAAVLGGLGARAHAWQ